MQSITNGERAEDSGMNTGVAHTVKHMRKYHTLLSVDKAMLPGAFASGVSSIIFAGGDAERGVK